MPTNNQTGSSPESLDSGSLTQGFSSLAYFDTEIKDLCNPHSLTGRSIFAFVQRELRNFHLDQIYCPHYIINEAYLRGRKKIENGVMIAHPKAWIRKTSFNVIRELSRKQKKTVSLDLLPEMESLPIMQESDLEIEFSTLRLAWQRLLPKEQQVLNLRIVEGLSYDKIATKLRTNEHSYYSAQTLRKFKERSLKRLRNLFYSAIEKR